MNGSRVDVLSARLGEIAARHGTSVVVLGIGGFQVRQHDQRAAGGDSNGVPVSATFARLLAWWTGWAVRRDWADGSREFVGFRASERGAARIARRDESYWRRGPRWPSRYAVVTMTRTAFLVHTDMQRCRDVSCPGAQRPTTSQTGIPAVRAT
jgi:hypothetical protein